MHSNSPQKPPENSMVVFIAPAIYSCTIGMHLLGAGRQITYVTLQ